MIPLSVLDLSVVTTGTKPAAALRNSIDLARHVDGLGYIRYWLAEHHNLASVAIPDDSPLPPIWLLGSSDYSSELAAQVGMGFAFAHHFASYDAVAAMNNYHAHFKKEGGWTSTPHGILAFAAVAAETDAEAEKL